MGRSAALDVAISLVDQPGAVRYASRSPLPTGVGLLLRLATREPGALRSAEEMTGQSPAALQAAAGFFIEQILFHPRADCYRILGASAGAPRTELRQHMVLLIKWLHPDGREQRVARADLDRGIFINRVTLAWEQLKTDERRAAYDRSLSENVAEKAKGRRRRRRARYKASGPKLPRKRSEDGPSKKGGFRRLIIYPLERESLLSRVLTYLRVRI